MVLVPGTRLGRYEIRSKIGEGGMGEVYLARDAQLDRAIAIKILTAEVARDQQRLHRFLQEARAASGLSHPNVAHIYEIGEDGGNHFIAMEYIEGQSLDRRVAGQPLPVSEILDIAIQIADALDEAHGKGITHRDIKPTNIMITLRGRVKVLDFGLAKLSLPGGAADRTSDSEIATRVKTSPGVVIGTVNYMSPEQALGREVDLRTDIFSFGIVLYEMATGRLPFTGNTVTETIDRIAHAQPEAIARLNYDVPTELELVVKKALRKERSERYQSIHDLLVDLKDLRRELDISERLEHSVAPAPSTSESGPTQFGASTTVSGASATSPVSAPQPTSSAEYLFTEIKRHKIGLLVGGIAVLLAIGSLGVGLYQFAGKRNRVAPTKKTAVPQNMKITRLTSSGKALHAAISPDGKLVVYVLKDGEQQSLWIKQIATNSNVQIVAPAAVEYYRETFSPDGNYVYYVVTEANNPNGALYQTPSLGGAPRKVLADLGSPITFSPDGNRIAFIRSDVAVTGEDQLFVANVDGSNERKLAARSVDKWFEFGGCGWSPDGKVIACPAGSYEGGLHLKVIAVDAETGNQNEFSPARFSDAGRVSWLADGSGVVINAAEQSSRSSQLWLVAYPGGEVHRITNDLNNYSGTSFTADTNTLVSVQSDVAANIWVASASDFARARQITSGKLEGTDGIVWTPDGRIIFTTLTSGNPDIAIMNSDGSNVRQLTHDSNADYSPSVSPDGYIVFVSHRSGFPSLWRMNLDGGALIQLTDGNEDYNPQITPDGKWILFESWRAGRRTLWKVSIDGGEPVHLLDKYVFGVSISPDGQNISCLYKDAQPNAPWRLMMLPLAGDLPIKTFDPIAPISATQVWLRGVTRWAPDGRAFTYLASQSGYFSVWSQPLDGGAPKKLTDFKGDEVWHWAWSRDGNQFAFTRGTTTNDVVMIRDFR